jgi:outer membrane protein OmpA-like peptidoglycan-associated protein
MCLSWLRGINYEKKEIEFHSMTMKRIAVSVIFLTIMYDYGWTQNLINNSRFDEFSTFLDSNKNIVYQPDFWKYNQSTADHPIYYSADRVLNPAITNNFHPEAELVRKGQKINYISVVLLPHTQRAYTKLVKPLTAGYTYHLSVDVKIFNQSSCFSDLLVGFTDSIRDQADSCLNELRLPFPDIIEYDSLFEKWFTLGTSFKAKGNEKVFVVSAGSPNEYSSIVKSDRERFVINPYDSPFKCKYFIDNVVLREAVPDLEKDDVSLLKINVDSIKIGENIVLHNIYFDFDRYELLEESFPILNSVYAFLSRDEKICVLISGHTDNIGTEEYNDKLSENRAHAVVEYLVKRGISRERLHFIGMGSRFPVDTSNTEQGRQRNRRIEMKILDR